MRARLLVGLSIAVCLIAACGGTETESDDFPGDDTPGGTARGDGGIVLTESFFDDGGVTVIADASADFDGGVGVTDGGASDLDSGAQGPRDAGPLSGALLRDANGAVLGEIISIQSEGAVFTIVTSSDYLVEINADGSFVSPGSGSLLYSDVSCGGSIYLEGATVPTEILGSSVIYSSIRGLLLPSGPLTNGAASSIPVSWQSVGDPCENAGKVVTGFYGWPLVPTTAANIGLPPSIAAPLSYP